MYKTEKSRGELKYCYTGKEQEIQRITGVRKEGGGGNMKGRRILRDYRCEKKGEKFKRITGVKE